MKIEFFIQRIGSFATKTAAEILSKGPNCFNLNKEWWIKMNLHITDPEFIERFEHFAFIEAVGEDNPKLDKKTRYMAILAALMGCGGVEAYKEILPQALDNGITPIASKEIVYQAAGYLGYGRMLPFLNVTNEIFAEKGVRLPLAGQATTTQENRLEKGIEAQSEIFGESMKEAWKAGHMNRCLAANCFGDYYTRNGLPLAERELITFCFLMAQGGCEPQLIAHSKGNITVGHDKDFLTAVVYHCLPYIGYPRSLNAIACVGKAVEE